MLALYLAAHDQAFAADKTAAAPSWKTDLLAWRAQQAKNLQTPNGWLTVIGLEWLKAGDNSFGSAKSNAAVIKAPTAPSLGVIKLNGESLAIASAERRLSQGTAGRRHNPGESASSRADSSGHPSKITDGSVTITIIHRGDRYGLRIKDSKAAAASHFHGLKWYAPNEAYRVQAKWIPYNPPHQVPVPTILGTEVMSEVPGAAEFTLDGKTWRLEPILESPDDKDLFFIFRDTTSKSETYGAGRFLYTPLARSRPDSARRGCARLQSRRESAVRVHAIRHVPITDTAEPLDDRDSGRPVAISRLECG